MNNNNFASKILKPNGRGKLWRNLTIILLITAAASLVDAGSYYNRGVDYLENKTNGTVSLPKTKDIPFRLGLDLMGGTHLVYNADVSLVPDGERANAVEGVRDVIEKRVNLFGVSEPLVQTNKSGGEYQVLVELAGVKDVSEAIKMIGETPLLEFKELASDDASLTDEQKKAIADSDAAAKKKAEDVWGKLISGGDFAGLAREFSDDAATKESGGDMGWIARDSQPELFAATSILEKGKYSEVTETDSGYEIVKLNDKRTKKNPFNNEDEKEVKASHILLCYKGAEGCTGEASKEEVYEKIKSLKEKATPANFKQLAKENSNDGGSKENGGDLGWFGRGVMVEPFEDTVFPQQKGTISFVAETKFGYHIIYKEDERAVEELNVSRMQFKKLTESDFLSGEQNWKNTELTGKNLERSIVQFDPNNGAPQVALEFDEEGSKLFEDITARNVSQPVAIFLDGYVISAPNVNEKITGGKAVISGSFNIKEAKLLAQRLNTGALPVPISLVNQQVIGPSLGQKSVDDSLRAGIIGFALVALFMVVYYRLPGLLSVMALIIYSILVLAVFKLWPVTLTLSGLAGFILSIGMAVDANVLIFERIKEELRAGRALGSALEIGFKRAWPSIRDSNSSSLITCLVLYMFYAGTIRGFAITLALGIVVSMFTAITITRLFLKLSEQRWTENSPWLYGVRAEKQKID